MMMTRSQDCSTSDRMCVLRMMVWSSSSIRRSEEHTSELQSQSNIVCRLLLEKKEKQDDFLHGRSAFRAPIREYLGFHCRHSRLAARLLLFGATDTVVTHLPLPVAAVARCVRV